MSYQTYLVMHFVGIFILLTALAGICFQMAAGGTRDWPLRKFAGMLHGLGLVIALVGGFGLLARIGIMHGSLPGWVLTKLVIWILLGAAPALIYRKGANTKLWIFVVLVLAAAACTLGTFKPGLGAPLSNPDAPSASSTN